MESEISHTKIVCSKSLLAAAMIFVTVVLVANLVGHKPLSISSLIISSGSTIFSLTYLITALITEIYGRENANTVIKLGLFCNMFAAFFISQTIHFPYPDYWDKQPHYEMIMQQTWQICVLSSLAYLCSEYANLQVFTLVTKKLKGKFFRLRVLCSTLFAVIVDTLLMIPIMINSSPSYFILVKKIASLILFKFGFVFIGLLFISFVRDYIVNIESKRRQPVEHDEEEQCNDKNNVDLIPNVYWYQQNKSR